MRWILCGLLVLGACVRGSPQTPAETPPAEPVNVPEGCLEPLGGAWIHATDQSYAYEGDDDGGTLVLRATHLTKPDAGFTPRKFRRGPEPVLLEPAEAAQAYAGRDGGSSDDTGVADAGSEPDAGAVYRPEIRVELTRTAKGFTGFTLAPLLHASGRTCEGRFATRVLSCADGGLVLESEPSTSLGESCQSPAKPRGASPLQHQLKRPDAG
ncbi:MAG: hypothetical protein ACO1OB_20575 [Archangium sp.]